MCNFLQPLKVAVLTCWIVLAIVASTAAQQQMSAVPTLVNFGGSLTDVKGMPLAGIVGVTFSLYKDQQGGTPLWLETQNVQPDRTGHYTVMLGSATSQGLPTGLFVSGEARWLGVRAQGQPEQPRVLLLSVPYALKAGDAQTLGGLPPSAFVPAATSNSTSASSDTSKIESPTIDAISGTGTAGFVPLWTNSTTLGNSLLFQAGSGSTAMIGVGTSTPAATFDVKGTSMVHGLLTLPAIGTATASAGKRSQAFDLTASAFNSGTAAPANQTFQWQAEPTGNNTTTPSASLNLLFGSGTSTPTETGLRLSSGGLFTFATGQTFPGTGTITAISTPNGSGLTGGGTSGSLSLSLTKSCAADQILQWNGTKWICSAAGAGTITGVNTPAGSGLTGGGSSGSLNLSLTKSCAANQVLQWNGTSWACSAAGNGTITGVTAGTDLTGGGTSGSITLNLDTTKVPQLNTSNTFSQTQVVSATNPFGAVLQASSPYQAIAGTMTTNDFFTPAVLGNASASGSGTTIGVEGSSSTDSGYGIYGVNSSTGTGVYGTSTSGTGVYGTSGGIGIYGHGNPAGLFDGSVQVTGQITSYNGNPTYAAGVPSIVDEYSDFSFGGGTQGYITLYTPPKDGVFRLMIFQECTGTSGGGTIFAPSFVWTIPTGGTGAYGGIGGPDCSGLNYFSETFVLHVKGGAPIQMSYPGMNAPFQNLVLIEQLL